MVFHSSSPKKTEEIAAQIAKKLKPFDVVAFTGGMGMGKTAFVRGAVSTFGDSYQVSSPTFAIVNEYETIPSVFHFDMYRITTEDDLYSAGFYEYLDRGGIIFIEWSENIAEYLPEETIYITIEKTDEDSRVITVKGDDRF